MIKAPLNHGEESLLYCERETNSFLYTIFVVRFVRLYHTNFSYNIFSIAITVKQIYFGIVLYVSGRMTIIGRDFIIFKKEYFHCCQQHIICLQRRCDWIKFRA